MNHLSVKNCLIARWVASISFAAALFFGHAQSVLYVDDNAAPGGNGQSWQAAFQSLQDALLAAGSSGGTVHEIRVAAGIYKPDRGINQTPGNRRATFRLLNGVALKGGYAGIGASNPDQRDTLLYPTVLSGDLLGNDQPNWGNYVENSYHIVSASNTDSTTLLDGFTIKGARAEWIYPDSSGAGIVIENSNLTIANCIVRDNLAQWGAGVLLLSGAPTFKNCVFSGNYAYIGRGGAMYNVGGLGGSNPTLIDCQFIGNRSRGTSSVGDGGAIFDESNTTLTLIRCHFVDNSSTANSPTYSNGGAISHIGSGLEAINCTFYRNTALVGGAVWVGSGARFVNCVFSGNSALAGGALYTMTYWANATFVNCVLSRNSADDGGGIYNGYNQVILTNCILWGNTATNALAAYKAQIHNSNSGGTARVTYSCVQGIFTPEPGEDPPNPADFPGCTEADPRFVDADGADNIPGTIDDNFHLQASSPCIDTGKNSALPADTFDLDEDGDTAEPTPLDLDGNWRFWDDPNTPDQGNGTPPIVDMGIYEFASQPPSVPGDANGDGCVDDADLAAVIFAFGSTGTGLPEDLNRDGTVDDADLAEVIFNFGNGCS